MENLPVNKKQPLYTNPVGQEADMIKIKTFSKSSCEIEAILVSATK